MVLLDDESRTSVNHSGPRLQDASATSHLISSHSLNPHISLRKEIWFGKFPDVCHAAGQSIRRSITHRQLRISEHGETGHPK